MTTSIPEYIDEIPCISGFEHEIETALTESKDKNLFKAEGGINFSKTRSCCVVALHMHQPLIPAGGTDLATADIISNLQDMMSNPSVGDNHNASVFHWCYKRMGEIIVHLTSEGKQPRIMLEYSGTLLHGLRHMGLNDVFEALSAITNDTRYRHCVEWLGAPWGHAVAPSTPVQDYRLHVKAWQQHFASIFGLEALSRVRGFSPSEMALPNHPDVAYEFVKTLKDCGYEWVLVQEHTVERPDNGWGPAERHFPHRLVCRNSRGEEASIVCLVKTQGSDTKLVAQMQPWFEASGLERIVINGKSVPRVVTQIADGENGGVMMNEFPPKYIDVVGMCSNTDTPLMNATEYLEHLWASGLSQMDLPVLQPIKQKQIWDRVSPGDGPEKLTKAISDLKQEDHSFHMDGGSWTNNISWVKGYDDILGPMERASSMFYENIVKRGIAPNSSLYRKALFYLLCSQTSCYRYWGQGSWTDYGKEICRRAIEVCRAST